MSERKRIALKVDCDTFEGTQRGIPALLSIFEKFGIKASFFFTLGPDRSGRAIRRIFTQKGFLKKMLRSNAVSLYGPKTMLYGTLLPAPMIGERLKKVIHSVLDAGHEVGVHGWDHVHWHDHLHCMDKKEVKKEYAAAHDTFKKIFGFEAPCSAAPGWQVSPFSLEVQEEFKLLYTSNTRIGSPFYPTWRGKSFGPLDIPTTLPTWDEALTDPQFSDKNRLLHFYGDAIKTTEVHTLHTEVEGTAYRDLFEQQLKLWLTNGVSFLTLGSFAREIQSNNSDVPKRELMQISIKNRGGYVSSSSLLPSVAAA